MACNRYDYTVHKQIEIWKHNDTQKAKKKKKKKISLNKT